MKPNALSTRFGLLTIATAALCLTCTSPAIGARAPRYAIHDLAALSGVQNMEAFRINNFSQIVGTVYGVESMQPFLFSRGKLTELNVDGQYGTAFNLNDRGQIIGYSSGPIQIFLYDDGELTDLRAATGQPITSVRAINNRGAIVGNVLQSDGPPGFQQYASAFVYADGQFRLLPTLPGGIYSDAFDINNRGQIAGQSSVRLPNADIVGRAVIWESGRIRNLGALPGATTSLCVGINDRGQVTGYSDSHGFIYSGGQIRSLGNLRGHFHNLPVDINNFGHIVGESSDAHFNERRAFLYADGVMRDLNDLLPRRSGWFLLEANGINDRGEIVGSGIHRNRSKAFVLKPIHPFKIGPK